MEVIDAELAVGLCLLACGGWLAFRKGRSRWTGLCVVTAGATWLGPVLVVGPVSTLFAHRPLLAFAVAAPALRGWPRQRTGRKAHLERPLAGALAAYAVVSLLPDLSDRRWLTAIVGSLVVGTCLATLRPASWPPVVALGGLVMSSSLLHLTSTLTNVERRGLYYVAVVAIAVLIVWGSARNRTDELIEAGVGAAGRGIVLGFRALGESTYRDAAGAVLDIPADARPIYVDAGEFGDAVVLHDEPPLEDPQVRDQVDRAVRLVALNVGLARRIAQQAEAVRASRQRLVEADQRVALLMRREVERDVLTHVASIDTILRAEIDAGAMDPADPAVDLLAMLREEVRALSSGLGLEAFGAELGPALHGLGGASRVPVSVVTGRLAELSQHTAEVVFMVTSEALANAVKYGGASQIMISVKSINEAGRRWCVVEVRDDGRGGAEERPGGGLAGIRDRVEGAGGHLYVTTARAGGTVVTARLPW